MSDLSCKSLAGGPSVLHESTIDRVPGNPRPLRPLSDAKSFPAEGDRSIYATITEVDLPCYPSAVRGRVRSIVIDPVDLTIRMRTLSHVAQEGLEGLSPARAYPDASTAVVPIAGIIGIVTSLDGRLPSRPLRGVVHSMGLSSRTPEFFTEASATLRSSRPEVLAERLDDVPAGASADPSRSLVASGVDVGVAGQGEDFEPTELMARKIHALAA